MRTHRTLIAAATFAFVLVAHAAHAQDRAVPSPTSPSSPIASAADSSTVYELSQVTVTPQLANRGELDRTRRMVTRDRRITGQVAVEIVIGRDGSVERARVLNDAAPALAEAALTVARAMRFSPARDGDLPVRVRVETPIAFRQ